MKTINHIKSYQIVATLLLFVLLLFTACQADHVGPINDKHAEDTHDDHDGSSSEKIVELTEKQYQLTNIKLGDFQMKNMSEVLNVNGYTKLPPHNQADVSVHVGGLIKSIRVLEGQYVKKGQTVATMESPEFATLHQAYLSSKSNLSYLQEDYKRQNQLQTDDVNAKKVVQKVKSDLEIEEAQFNALGQQLRLLNINPEGKISTIVPIRAPISGHLTEVFIKIGSAITPNTPLFSLVDNSEMHIDLLVYEKDLYKVEVGQKLRFVLTNQSHTEINGTIFNIGKSFENETKSVAVHAHIDNHDVDLIPGMYINALIDVGSHKTQTLPSSAIIDDLGRKYIFVLESNSQAAEEGHDVHDHAVESIHQTHEGHDHVTENNDKPNDHAEEKVNAVHDHSAEEINKGHDHSSEESAKTHDHAAQELHEAHDHGTEKSHDAHDHGTKESSEKHDHGAETDHFDFRRVEVKIGAEQLGSIEVELMGTLKATDKIVIEGAYYLQSHLQKSEGNGGGHSH